MHAENWRFIDLDVIDIGEIYGVEEAIARSESPATLLLWRANKPIITLGCFQKVEEELDLLKCRMLGLDIVRRITNGGTFLIGPDILSYSLIVSEKNGNIPSSIEKSYEIICMGVVEALWRMGLKAKYSPIKNILVDNKKISGNAQTRAFGKIIHQGFVNLVLDFSIFSAVFNIHKDYQYDKELPSLKDRVTWIDKEIIKIGKFPVFLSKLKSYLKYGFELTFKARLIPEELTYSEKEKAAGYAGKFSQDNWQYVL